MKLSPTRLKGTRSPWHAATTHETAQDRACQETQSNTGFCYEPAVGLHFSAPLHCTMKSCAMDSCLGCWGQPRAQGSGLERLHQAVKPCQAVTLCAAKCKERANFHPDRQTHCRTGGQTMRISQLTFEPKTKYLKSHSGAQHTPSSHFS